MKTIMFGALVGMLAAKSFAFEPVVCNLSRQWGDGEKIVVNEFEMSGKNAGLSWKFSTAPSEIFFHVTPSNCKGEQIDDTCTPVHKVEVHQRIWVGDPYYGHRSTEKVAEYSIAVNGSYIQEARFNEPYKAYSYYLSCGHVSALERTMTEEMKAAFAKLDEVEAERERLNKIIDEGKRTAKSEIAVELRHQHAEF